MGRQFQRKAAFGLRDQMMGDFATVAGRELIRVRLDRKRQRRAELFVGAVETISAHDLAVSGSTHMRRLRTELAIVEDVLLHWGQQGMANQ